MVDPVSHNMLYKHIVFVIYGRRNSIFKGLLTLERAVLDWCVFVWIMLKFLEIDIEIAVEYTGYIWALIHLHIPNDNDNKRLYRGNCDLSNWLCSYMFCLEIEEDGQHHFGGIFHIKIVDISTFCFQSHLFALNCLSNCADLSQIMLIFVK